jgi:RHS repeat-associated protein
MYEAARVTDPIAHTSALAGFLIGALIGIALIAAVAFATFTCGFGVALLAGLAAGIGASAILGLGEAIGKMFSSPAGQISVGSPNVFTNDLPAARVKDGVICSKHNPLPLAAEGSSNVFINDLPASRKDDKITCGAKIDDGSPNVFIGGGTVQYLPVADEVPAWLRTAVDWAFALAGLVGGLAGLAKHLASEGMELTLKSFTPCAAKFIGGFVLGEAAGRYVIGPTVERVVGGLVGHPVDVTTGRKLLLAHEETDFSLPGHIPLTCARFYASDLEREGALGRGWVLPWELRLERRDDKIHYFDAQGREMIFPKIEPGHSLFSEAEQRTLACTRDGRYVIHDLNETYYEFDAFAAIEPSEPAEASESAAPSDAAESADSAEPADSAAPRDPQPLPATARLRRMEDQRGHWCRYDYAADGTLQTIRSSSGQYLQLQYAGPPGRLTTIDLLEGGTPGPLVRYTYDESSQLIGVTDALGRLTRAFGYIDGRMAWHRSAGGFECHYRWAEIDGAARVVEQHSSEGERYTFDYDPAARQTRATDELGRQATWHFDDQRQIIDSTDFDGRRYRTDYNPAGHPVALYLPGGRTIRLEYDALGRLVRETDPLGRVTATAYAGNSLRIAQRTLPDGRRYRADYDLRGLLLAVTDPLGRTERYDYDENDNSGLPHTHTDARGGQQHLQWNRRGQLTAYTDCSGKTTRYDYDENGHPSATIDALGARTEYTCARTGEITRITLPDGRAETYDYAPSGALVRHTDAFGHVRSWQHNPRGQVIAAIDPARRPLHYAYDARGYLVRLSNANGAHYQFDYDPAGRLTREIRPDGIERQLHYDEAGELASQIMLGAPPPATGGGAGARAGTTPPPPPERAIRETRFERDLAGRLLAQHTATAVTAYIWNGLDQLLEATRTPTEAGRALGIETDRVAFDYDPAGRLIAEHGANGRLHYALDELDNLAALTLPQGQRIDTLTYGSGHVHQVRLGEQVISDFERDDLHREVMRTQGRLTQRCGYDPLGRRTWQSASFGEMAGNMTGTAADEAGAGAFWRRYRFDRQGELAEQGDSLRGTTHYRYDPAGQLSSRTPAQAFSDEQFAWDAAGNLLDDIARKSRGRVEDNRLTVWQDIRFDYDPFGNLRQKQKGSRQTQTFTYDADDRLLEVRTRNVRDEVVTRFAYDALGRRIRRDESRQAQLAPTPYNETRRFVWQGLRLVQEIRDSGVSNYLYSPEAAYTPLARIDQMLSEGKTDVTGPAAVFHFHTDLIGTPMEVTDETGELAWAGQYQAWGKVDRQAGEQIVPRIEQPLRFPGQYADEATGLHYNTFRYYDPDVGRFITQDPIGLAGGENLYAYAPNPTGWMDPWGWMPWAWNGDTGMGHHLVPRGKANSIGLTHLGTARETPTFFPEPYKAGMHESLHQAQRPHIGKIQGPWTGSADELLAASRKGLADLPQMRGTLKIPATGEVLATGVTPTEAFDKLTDWHNAKLKPQTSAKPSC